MGIEWVGQSVTGAGEDTVGAGGRGLLCMYSNPAIYFSQWYVPVYPKSTVVFNYSLLVFCLTFLPATSVKLYCTAHCQAA